MSPIKPIDLLSDLSKILRVYLSQMRGANKFAIVLANLGCKNRPFYQLVVTNRRGRTHEGDGVEQIGSFDPLPNENNEKLVGLNLERIRFWLSKDVSISKPVAEILGLSGYLPLHPLTFIRAKRNRKVLAANDASVEPQKESQGESAQQP